LEREAQVAPLQEKEILAASAVSSAPSYPRHVGTALPRFGSFAFAKATDQASCSFTCRIYGSSDTSARKAIGEGLSRLVTLRMQRY
jgi:hypothetical protein